MLIEVFLFFCFFNLSPVSMIFSRSLREHSLLHSLPWKADCELGCCTCKGSLPSFASILIGNSTPTSYQLFPSHFPLKPAFLCFIRKRASLIPDVLMLPGHPVTCRHHLFFITWRVACFRAHVMYSVYLWADHKTNFLTTEGGGSRGSLHVSIYCFTLEKSFTLCKPQHLK